MLSREPTPESAPSPTATVRRRRVLVAEIACLMCARSIGTILADRWPPRRSVLFTTPESTRARPLATWWQLRCPIGGGNTAATEVEVHTVRHEPPPDWQDDPPRRGRPPAWLVAQRQAARQADGDCA
jgi:hypothetical protein